MSLPLLGSSSSSSSTDSNGPLTPPNTTRMRLSRKRTVSTLSDDEEEDTKRQRLTRSISFAERSSGLNESYHGDPFSIMRSPTTTRTYSRLSRSLKPRPSLLSAASSYSDISTSRRSEADEAMQSGLAMMRSASVTSMDLRASSPAVVSYPETSAHHHMRLGKVFIDFSVVAPEDEAGKTWPVSWSVNNVLVFGRGNRVHYKNLAVNEDVAQLCKLKDNHGDLRLLECGGKDQVNVVAAGTSTGHIQMWDLATKKNTGSWQVNGATAMKWNGQQLTVGLQKGAIKHYDTRAPKIKDSVKKVTRHQAKITSLAWNTEGRYYASGDETGTVFVWDIRQNGVPLEDLGDMIQRRRKIQHSGAVTALAWCPWQSKILATGDTTSELTGTIRIWTIGGSSFVHHSTYPDKIEMDAPITSLHFSPHCKEILSTHGPGQVTPTPPTYTEDLQIINNDPILSPFHNSVVVHSYPSLKHVMTLAGATSNIAGSLLSPNGQKLVLAVPGESKLKIWDVWGRPVIRRQASALSIDGRIR